MNRRERERENRLDLPDLVRRKEVETAAAEAMIVCMRFGKKGK